MLTTIRCDCTTCPACRVPAVRYPLPPGAEITLLWHECDECGATWGHVLPDHDEAQGVKDSRTWERVKPPTVIVG